MLSSGSLANLPKPRRRSPLESRDSYPYVLTYLTPIISYPILPGEYA